MKFNPHFFVNIKNIDLLCITNKKTINIMRFIGVIVVLLGAILLIAQSFLTTAQHSNTLLAVGGALLLVGAILHVFCTRKSMDK